jgi:hypothetical protein
VPLDQAFKCAEAMALDLLNAGAKEVLEAIRAEKEE